MIAELLVSLNTGGRETLLGEAKNLYIPDINFPLQLLPKCSVETRAFDYAASLGTCGIVETLGTPECVIAVVGLVG